MYSFLIRFEMSFSSKFKHAVHVVSLFGLILAFEMNVVGLRFYLEEGSHVDYRESYSAVTKKIILHLLNFVNFLNLSQSIIIIALCALLNPLLGSLQLAATFGVSRTLLLWFLRLTCLASLPLPIFSMLGLTLINAFPDKVQLKMSPKLAPFICIRVVTRGYYPDLVRDTVKTNIEICQNVGLENFGVEVVTDIPINLPKHSRVREIVVPDDYRTKSNSLFKARALQYCLEEGVNTLRDDDWIVHLDEESLLTEDSVRGILNFCTDGQHQFGQGVITLASGQIVNWLVTLSDSVRVANDMSWMRFQFYYLHRPVFGCKGSYIVAQALAERRVSFDHGPDGSISEDIYFSMMTLGHGYSFGFVEGELQEKSPFTIWDYVKQRKRWAQGLILTVGSRDIPVKRKIFLTLILYCWATMPLCIVIVSLLAATGPFPANWFFDSLVAFLSALNLYMHIYGAIRQYGYRHQNRPWILVFYSFGAICTIPFRTIVESIAVIWAIFGRKHNFYIVKKVHTD